MAQQKTAAAKAKSAAVMVELDAVVEVGEAVPMFDIWADVGGGVRLVRIVSTWTQSDRLFARALEMWVMPSDTPMSETWGVILRE